MLVRCTARQTTGRPGGGQPWWLAAVVGGWLLAAGLAAAEQTPTPAGTVVPSVSTTGAPAAAAPVAAPAAPPPAPHATPDVAQLEKDLATREQEVAQHLAAVIEARIEQGQREKDYDAARFAYSRTGKEGSLYGILIDRPPSMRKINHAKEQVQERTHAMNQAAAEVVDLRRAVAAARRPGQGLQTGPQLALSPGLESLAATPFSQTEAELEAQRREYVIARTEAGEAVTQFNYHQAWVDTLLVVTPLTQAAVNQKTQALADLRAAVEKEMADYPDLVKETAAARAAPKKREPWLPIFGRPARKALAEKEAEAAAAAAADAKPKIELVNGLYPSEVRLQEGVAALRATEATAADAAHELDRHQYRSRLQVREAEAAVARLTIAGAQLQAACDAKGITPESRAVPAATKRWGGFPCNPLRQRQPAATASH